MTNWSDPFQESEFMLNAIQEVRSDKKASEYDFLEEIDKIHSSPSKKGNNGLANAYAELAIYKENGEIKVDEGLLDELDKRLAEAEGVNKRHRFRGIVAESEKRPGNKKSLLENEVDGHVRIVEKIEAFYKATNNNEKLQEIYEEDGKPLGEITDGGPQQKDTISAKSENSQQKQGGENMTDYDDLDELNDFIDYLEDVATAVERGLIDSSDAADNVREFYEENIPNEQMDEIEERYESLGHAVNDLLDDSYDIINGLETVAEVEEQKRVDKVNNAEAHANYLGNRLDQIEDTMDKVDRMLGR